MASLNEFISSIASEGLMRTNRFSAFFTLPPGISQGGYTTDLRKVLLYCDAVNLPGLSFATTEAKTYGEIREMPYQRLFETINMTFYMDNSMSIKLLFDSWMATVIDPSTRVTNYYRNYTTDIDLIVYDIKDNSRYQVKLYQCYPKAIGAIQMDYANKDIMKMTVTFIVKYWESSSSQQTTNYDNLNQPILSDPTAIPNNYFTNFQSFQQSTVQQQAENAGNIGPDFTPISVRGNQVPGERAI